MNTFTSTTQMIFSTYQPLILSGFSNVTLEKSQEIQNLNVFVKQKYIFLANIFLSMVSRAANKYWTHFETNGKNYNSMEHLKFYIIVSGNQFNNIQIYIFLYLSFQLYITNTRNCFCWNYPIISNNIDPMNYWSNLIV